MAVNQPSFTAVQNPGNPLESLWISANAGSGKTFQLTRRVLKLLLLGVTPERICCITYTKAAAGEMRERIITELRELLLADEKSYRAKLEEFLGGAPTPEQAARGRLLFGQVLDSPFGGVQLTTIHGFCQQLLKSFPLEAGIAPHFTVADDEESALIATRVKHRLLDRYAVRDEALSETISLIAERSTETTFNALAKNILAHRETWQRIWHLQTPATMKERIYALHGVDPSLTPDALLAQLRAHLSAAHVAVIRPALASLQSGGETERRVGECYARWLENPQPEDIITVWYTQEHDLRARPLTKAITQQAALTEALLYSREATVRYCEQLAALSCAQESTAFAVLADRLLQLYMQAKDERSVLDYHDLIEKTETLVHGDMAAWVMTKLDHRIDHLLIDEAQDTSAGQWHIAKELVRELMATSGGIGSADVPRSLLVVGDEKQSIYSFQGAAPEIYAREKPNFAELLGHGAAPLRERKLLEARRSTKAILNLVDAVAHHPQVKQGLSHSGTLNEHKLVRKEEGGRVVLHAPTVPEEKIKLPPLTIPTEYQLAQNAAQLLADKVAGEVSAKVRAGEWKPGDVMILVRKRNPIVKPLLRALQRKGLPVAGMDRLVLAEHLAVKDLLALMRWCANERDDLALAQVLRSPLVGISDEALRAMAHGREGTLWARVSVQRQALLRWREMAAATPYDFLTRVLEEDGARRRFAARFGNEVHEILDELKSQAADISESQWPSLLNFCQHVAGSDQQIKRELESGGAAIRVMTAYGAKGLEAPVVLMVDTTSLPDVNKETMFTTRDAAKQLLPVAALSFMARQSPVLEAAKRHRQQALLNEYYRLMYVALTRARDELHIFGMEQKGKIHTDSWYALLRETMKQLPGVKEAGGDLILQDAAPMVKTDSTAEATTAVLPAWATHQAQKPRRVARLSPSKIVGDKVLPFARVRIEGAKERGVRIHRVLQFLAPDTTQSQVARLVKHVAPDWSEAEQQQVGAEIWQLFTQERWLFESGEAELGIAGELTINGVTYPISGQMDRLVVRGDEVIVLDYKTARDVPASAAGVDVRYLFQMKTYMDLLGRLYPHNRIGCAIVWTAGPSLMWLTDEARELPWDKALTPTP